MYKPNVSKSLFAKSTTTICSTTTQPVTAKTSQATIFIPSFAFIRLACCHDKVIKYNL